VHGAARISESQSRQLSGVSRLEATEDKTVRCAVTDGCSLQHTHSDMMNDRSLSSGRVETCILPHEHTWRSRVVQADIDHRRP